MINFDILLPVYRPVPGYLDRAVKSITDQSYGKWRLYIVDDNSPDDSYKWIKSRFADYPKIYTESLAKNRRAAVARNLGAARGRGAVITFIDQDDFWHRNKLRIYAQFFSCQPEIQVVHSDIEWVDAKGEKIPGKAEQENAIRRKIPYSEYKGRRLAKELFRYYSVRIGTLAVQRRAWEKVKGYDSKLFGGEDQDLVLRLAARFKMAHIPRGLTFRRHHDQQVTRQYHKRREWGKLRFYLKTILKFPELWKSALGKIGSSLKRFLIANDSK